MRATIAVMMFSIGVGTAAPAGAEILPPGRLPEAGSAMMKYLFSKDFSKRMYDSAASQDRQLNIGCSGQYTIRPLSLYVTQTVDLPDGAAHAAAGIWVYRFEARRCDSTKLYNLMMTAQTEGAPKATNLLPGDTLASVKLMIDTVRAAYTAARAKIGAECKDVRVFDTAVVQKPHAVTEGGKTYQNVWNETWTIKGCEKEVVLPVTFTPMGDGVNYFIGK